jgi:hypothetical protein
MFSIEVNDNINKIIQNVDATKAKVELATIRALNKTALWIKSQAIREISKEKQIQQKLIRKRLKVIKASKSSIRALVTVGLYRIRAARLGTMKQANICLKVHLLLPCQEVIQEFLEEREVQLYRLKKLV